MPPQSRHLFWREIIAEAFPGMTVYAPEGISADLSRWKLGSVGLARARSGRAHISRIANRNAGNVIVHLQRRGRLTMTHGGGAVSAAAGDIVIADDSRPYAIEISEGNECLILQLPAAELGEALAGRDCHGWLLRGDDPNVAFLGHMLQGLWGQRELYDSVDGGVGDLLADAARLVCRCSPSSAMTRIDGTAPVEYALRHLDDPALGTAMICEATGLSPRAVQKAFLRHAALTPTAFIAERRLARAADLLGVGDGRSITDVALEVGFNDPAFFSRCFRRRFGIAPRDWRGRAPTERPLV